MLDLELELELELELVLAGSCFHGRRLCVPSSWSAAGGRLLPAATGVYLGCLAAWLLPLLGSGCLGHGDVYQ
jgi:hypothetical protein